MHSADEKCVVSKFISIFQVNRHTETVSLDDAGFGQRYAYGMAEGGSLESPGAMEGGCSSWQGYGTTPPGLRGVEAIPS